MIVHRFAHRLAHRFPEADPKPYRFIAGGRADKERQAAVQFATVVEQQARRLVFIFQLACRGPPEARLRIGGFDEGARVEASGLPDNTGGRYIPASTGIERAERGRHGYHSVTEPSALRQIGLFQLWPTAAISRTLASSISMPRPGLVKSGT